MVSHVEEYMLKINNSGKRLSKEQAILFHRLVAKFLFFIKHTSPDVHPTIAFLKNKVIDQYGYDW